jgi:hypothetical protein
MTRLLVAAVVAGGVLSVAPAANACTIDTCWFTQPVCSRVSCHVCYVRPDGPGDCIT